MSEKTSIISKNGSVSRFAGPGYRNVKIVAVVTGLIGFLLACLSPLMPVNQTTAQLNWPQDNQVVNVAAPLVSFVPTDVRVSVPCTSAAELPSRGGVLLSTLPVGGQDATSRGLFIRATSDSITVTDRDVVLLTADRAVAQANPDCRINFNADGERAYGDIVDGGTEGQLSFDVPDPNLRPQIVGVFTELPDGASPEGMAFSATIDTRFVTTPTNLKFAAMVIGIVMTVVSLIALALLDARDGRGHTRFLPARWWTIRISDVVVFAILGLWWLMGSNTSDDGYNFTVGRIAGEAGYVDNYYRYYGVPQDPFGWHYQVISAMTNVSLSAPWMRLPAFLLGLLGWWLISREVIPRLGRTVRNSTPALWSALFVFLAIWMPFNNGLRPEPALAVGALLTWCSVDRSIATGRLLPLAVAAIIASFTLALAPGGLMAVALLLAGIRPLLRRIMARRGRDGLLPLLMPILAAGTAVLYNIFADQTLATILTSSTVASEVGPTLEWWQEPVRYYYLMLPTADGTLSRRFGILMAFLCLVVVLLMLLRRRTPMGIPKGPTWRLVAGVFGFMFFLAFTPTKWTHHLGVYAGIGAALAAAAGAMMAPAILRRRRNRTFFAAAVLYVAALSFAGTNGWWFVASYGIPWWDQPPAIAGIKVTWIILVIAVATTLVGLYQHFRDDYVGAEQRTEGSRFWHRFAFSPMPVISGLVVLFMLLSFVKAAYEQRDSWSWLNSNLAALQGDTCALANDVLVEPDPNLGLLQPATVEGQVDLTPGEALAGTDVTGFTPNGVPNDLSVDATESTEATTAQNTAQTGAGSDETDETDETGTGGGQGALGVNGSTARLPFGLNPANTPVLGSYGSSGGSATSAWYQMPEANSAAPLLTLSASGRIQAVDGDGIPQPGQKLVVEFGRPGPGNTVEPLGQLSPIDIGEPPIWRNLRFPLSDAPTGASLVRVIASDTAGAPDQWLAFTPPRITKMETLNDLVGQKDPVMIDWLPALVFPCQQPMAVKYGVIEVPKWRILPDAQATRQNSQTWMSGDAGGPLGITQAMLRPTIVPSYLRNDWGRDWGSLQQFTAITEAKTAELEIGSTTHSGLYDPAPMRGARY
ncbi:arabinosyltransferase domain-containing protein [Williamsia sp.]|uniref:arabinosyltransferase domain-containing protein n=1 Tax=Williamsia sp. TaxID=1872085 RepID=UPI002F928F7E